MKHGSLIYLRRHRFELYVALLLFVSSIPYVLSRVPKPMSIDELLPPVIRLLWAFALLLGSTCVLVSLFCCMPRLEFIGLLILAWPAMIYGVAVIIFTYDDTTQQGRGVFTCVLAILTALFCLDRAWELWRFRP